MLISGPLPLGVMAATTLLLMPCAAIAQRCPQETIQPGTVASADTKSTSGSEQTAGTPKALPPLRTVQDYWKLLVDETISPISAAGTVFNAGFSQLTRSDPQYGTGGAAFAQRLGASAADIAAENFFGDFLVASALHEDPRYVRRGEHYSFLYRTGYAISRALVIRTVEGNGFNWDNILGSAMSAGLSNAYYPSRSRTGGATLIHFATAVADNGFVNLAPEFWPDFERKFFRHRHTSGLPGNGSDSNSRN